MDNICTYHVEVKGQIDESDLSTGSPLEMVVVRVTAATTLFVICTDQSGLMGMIRFLHGRGFVLLSVVRREETC
jgi:hypothetical protein